MHVSAALYCTIVGIAIYARYVIPTFARPLCTWLNDLANNSPVLLYVAGGHFIEALEYRFGIGPGSALFRLPRSDIFVPDPGLAEPTGEQNHRRWITCHRYRHDPFRYFFSRLFIKKFVLIFFFKFLFVFVPFSCSLRSWFSNNVVLFVLYPRYSSLAVAIFSSHLKGPGS